MTYEQIALAAVAAAVVAWPKVVDAYNALRGRLPSVSPAPIPSGIASVGYEEAIHNLAVVRARLNTTALLGDEKSPQRAAIDTLTLALVAGSDK